MDAARTITSSLERVVAERTVALSATRDRLSELAGQLAADLRSHLDSMHQQLDAFATAEAALGADALRSVAKASAAIGRLSVMTDRLHEVSCVGAHALRPERVDMAVLVREVIDDHLRTSGDARIEWRVAPQLPAAWADPAVVRAVVENLVSNAIKYSRRRQPPRIDVGHD